MRIVVTGGAGFIGSHVADAFIERGDDVLVVDDLSSGNRDNVPDGAKFTQLDIRDDALVHATITTFNPDAISHHAAQASVTVSVREPVLDAEINVIGSIHLAQAALATGARFIFASTGGALYGEVQEGELANTTWPATPLSPYACSKASFELYLRALNQAEALQATILRYGNVYGPRQDPHGEAGVVAIFVRRLLTGQSIQVNARRTLGDAGCIRDYVYVSDAVRANLAAADGTLDLRAPDFSPANGRPVARTLNVGTGIGSATRTLAEHLAKAVDGDHTILDGDTRPGDLERSVLDPTEFVSMFGEPVDLATGLAATADWFRNQLSA